MSSLFGLRGGALSNYRFGTAINCIDGRVQESVARWLKVNCQLDYIDAITEPGVDKLLAEGGTEIITALRRKVEISVHIHKSSLVALIGHFNCASNPSSQEVQLDQIRQGVAIIRLWDLPVMVIGLWVNALGGVEPIA